MDEPTRDELLEIEVDIKDACDSGDWGEAFNVSRQRRELVLGFNLRYVLRSLL